jgi:hypothetical protein
MLWSEIRSAYPDRWLVVEAVEAYTTLDNKRQIKKFAVVEQCNSGREAFISYQRNHKKYPQREYYFLHTSREDLDIREQHRLGIRRSHEAHAER